MLAYLVILTIAIILAVYFPKTIAVIGIPISLYLAFKTQQSETLDYVLLLPVSVPVTLTAVVTAFKGRRNKPTGNPIK